ncbi:MAG: 23S rRNA (pseudouridine(1915)-N(3))-methyltransferase RlmH [Deferribacteraceae bacterium]|jgi:23S rRNA (pseudouridine1915-N3)-methyltransferase|nr:23S rRNA (pseudouridine(1915)-N(3))-methyltransferase RlmH [Deferribacteraceae bacterium]
MIETVVILEGKSRNAEAVRWFNEYARRLSGALTLAEWGGRKKERQEKFFNSLPQDALVVSLDAAGVKMNSSAFAKRLYELEKLYHKLYIFIGEAEGHSETVLLRARECWSLSELTFPYDIALIVLSEQIYRAGAIRSNHPYHK